MTELKELPVEIPSSSGESENQLDLFQRTKKKPVKLSLSSTKISTSQIPRNNSANYRSEIKHPLSFRKPKPVAVPSSCPRLKKSFSQIDMKMSKNMNNTRFNRNLVENNYNKIAMPKPTIHPITFPTKDFSNFPTKEDSYFYLVNEPECPELAAKLAGMKIFASIMLNSWRKRRDEVRHLKEEVDRLERRGIKVKNQVHVLSSVFRNEQKQNEKLHRQLRHSAQDIQNLQTSIENLTTSLISAKADSSFFEQQFHAKEQECDSLNNIVVETNSQLFKSMTQVRQLQTSLSSEQRNVQQLENQKNDLMNELALTETKWRNIEEQHLMKVYQKDGELAKANSEIKILETLLVDLKEKEFQVRDFKKSDAKLKTEIENLKAEIESLKVELNKCVGSRVKRLWQHYLKLNSNTIMMLHLAAFYLLPGVPPPKSLKIPFSLSLDKVISFIR